MSLRLRLLVVDDHPLMVEAIRLALGTSDGFEIVGVATSGTDIVSLVRQTTPDVVLLDLRMPGVDGLTALRALRRVDTETKVIALSGLEDPELVARVLGAGATAFIMKRIDAGDLAAGIRQALDQTVFTASPQKPELANGNGSQAQLNERELEILHGVGEGLSNRQIAERAWLAEQTVKFHLTHIYRKLGVSSRTEAVAAAYRSGLIEDLFAGARRSARTTSS